MWFLIAVLVILWLIGYITFGSGAYWVHALLLTALVLFAINLIRRGRRAPKQT